MIYGVFGGTFDPPHLGHLQIVDTVLNSKLVDEIFIIPCLIHVFGKNPVSFEDRLNMCSIMFDSHSKLTVLDIEKELNNPGRTFELLQLLIKKFSNSRFRLIAGLDIFYERKKWYKFKEIEKIAPPIYLKRKGIEIKSESLPNLLDAPIEVSSSDIRKRFQTGQKIENLVTPSVNDYIINNKLYGVK
ncbi:MAG: nicotinate (nicotinamide) nucleotide adenylyltransferase [Deltaproteobacteria bacterium]|nr:nicotinate (nicotinamide) nucleotide adenylyltransferase [Deltaproteobacteria bacterium]